MTEQTIPVVDLRDFNEGTLAQKEAFVQTVGNALVDLGFFAIENHGVDDRLIQECYSVTEKFFLYSDQTKTRYEDLELRGQRGFTSFGREHAKGETAPDIKEFWHVGREWNDPTTPKDIKNYPANIWPEEIPEFKPLLLELYRQLEASAMTLLDACSLFVGMEQNFFRNIATGGNSILRVIHYPPIPKEIHPNSIRAAAHEDINLITLLCESTAEGLELLQRDGKWRPIKSLSGQIIADAGDMIQNITNGLLKSTTHRVVNPNNDRERRFSMPFFVHARSEVSLSPLVNCIEKTGGQKAYPDITAEQYLDQRLSELRS